MPYPKADEPLSKLTLNLFAQDVVRLKVRYGRGWQEEVRRIIREHLGVPSGDDDE
jgi:hypothetical protein